MSDHQFEKNVRQQLEELKFPPGEAVWTGVEKRIASRRRRRRGIIWIPVLLLLITAGYWMSQYNSTGHSTPITTTSESPVNDKESSATTASEETGISVAPPSSSSANATQKQSSENVQATVPSGDINRTQQANRSTHPEMEKNHPSLRSTASRAGQQKVIASIQPVKKGKASAHTSGAENKSIAATLPKNQIPPATPEIIHNKVSTETENKMSRVTQTGSLMDSIAIVAAKPSDETEADSVGSMVAIAPAPSSVGSDSTGIATIPRVEKRKARWQWGITIQGGISNVTEGGFFDVTQKSMVQDVAANSFSSPLPANAVLPKPSDIRPATSFAAGFFIKKPVSKRIDLSAGLNYVFLQTSIQVGQWAQNNQLVLNARGAMDVNAYYRAGTQQKYYNQYHILEVPLQAAIRLNKRRQFPVTLTTGLSLGTLVKSNALHFDGASRVYYQDNSLFNKTQFGFSGGLSIGLLQRTAHPVAIGPFFHYRASNLMKHAVSGERHLQAFGLDLKVLLKK